jgi:hypothetical protein
VPPEPGLRPSAGLGPSPPDSDAPPLSLRYTALRTARIASSPDREPTPMLRGRWGASGAREKALPARRPKAQHGADLVVAVP